MIAVLLGCSVCTSCACLRLGSINESKQLVGGFVSSFYFQFEKLSYMSEKLPVVHSKLKEWGSMTSILFIYEENFAFKNTCQYPMTWVWVQYVVSLLQPFLKEWLQAQRLITSTKQFSKYVTLFVPLNSSWMSYYFSHRVIVFHHLARSLIDWMGFCNTHNITFISECK